MNSVDIINFWFDELSLSDWFRKDENLDQLIKDRFSKVHQQAAAGELFNWRKTAKGRLAEIIILDQFSRNLFRDTPQAFAYDGQALILSQEAVCQGADKSLTPPQKAFLYMPHMHSESKKIHEIAISLFSQPGLEDNLEFEKKHKTIIDRFGRYPHRNKILRRTSTNEEIEFLKEADSSF